MHFHFFFETVGWSCDRSVRHLEKKPRPNLDHQAFFSYLMHKTVFSCKVEKFSRVPLRNFWTNGDSKKKKSLSLRPKGNKATTNAFIQFKIAPHCYNYQEIWLEIINEDLWRERAIKPVFFYHFTNKITVLIVTQNNGMRF